MQLHGLHCRQCFSKSLNPKPSPAKSTGPPPSGNPSALPTARAPAPFAISQASPQTRDLVAQSLTGRRTARLTKGEALLTGATGNSCHTLRRKGTRASRRCWPAVILTAVNPLWAERQQPGTTMFHYMQRRSHPSNLQTQCSSPSIQMKQGRGRPLPCSLI